MTKFIVTKEIPSRRDLHSFDYFDSIPIGSILINKNDSCCLYWNDYCICDIGSKWEKEYLKRIK